MLLHAIEGHHVLLTGVTGFLGKVWLAHLLHHVPDVRVTVVVRSRGREGARERLERLIDTSPAFRPLRQAHGRDLGRWLGARLTVAEGDIELPLLGLRLDELEPVDAVVHCAGLTDFQPDPLRALAVNTHGARHAADVAVALGARMLHVSTAYVAGNVSGEVAEALEVGRSPSGLWFDPEEEIARVERDCEGLPKSERIRVAAERAEELGWPNLYTFSKALAEHLVAARRELRLAIVRPSVVECARSFPFEGWNEGVNTAGPLAWLISTAFRDLPTQPEHVFDIVPVDDVARGMTLVLGALLRGEAAPVYHLASGDANPLTFGRTVELTGLALRRWTRLGRGRRVDGLYRHLDPVPSPQGGLVTPSTLRRFVGAARKALRSVELPEALGELAEPTLRSWRGHLVEADATLGQIEKMLELYRPFIHDNDPIFRTDRIRRLGGALPAEHAEHAWVVPAIDWRWYWVDVEYPGLCTWTFPLIRRERVPTDPPSVPPFRLEFPERPAMRHDRRDSVEAR